MKTKMLKKEYYLFTHPDLPGYRVYNYGDRLFDLEYPSRRCWKKDLQVSIGGDLKWDLNEENIKQAANAVFEYELEEIKEEENENKKQKEPSVFFKEMDGVFKDFDKVFEKMGNLFKKHGA